MAELIGARIIQHWDGPVPVQEIPETSSDDRMHVMDETCWCHPEVTEVPSIIRHHEES
ncbi:MULTISPECIES: hypothetical protein [Nocardia]|uniref:hypothetical protein n=1 Tax=Nocardia TaxID=1817 RepID=UPI0024545B8C|nr:MULTISPECIES: hypothetical protein [Nocardia]